MVLILLEKLFVTGCISALFLLDFVRTDCRTAVTRVLPTGVHVLLQGVWRKALRFVVAAPSFSSEFLSVFLWRHYCISDRLKFHIWI